MKYSIVVNNCYGGFSLSKEGVEYMRNHGVECEDEYSLTYDFPRHHPVLVKMVEELGSEKASGRYAKLAIEKIKSPFYLIDEYDGIESVITPDIDWIDARDIKIDKDN